MVAFRTRNLLECLRDRHDDVVAFCYDTRIPPTNNQAEFGLRPHETQQKVSGRLLSENVTRDRLQIRGYISTAAKHGADIMTALCATPSSAPPGCHRFRYAPEHPETTAHTPSRHDRQPIRNAANIGNLNVYVSRSAAPRRCRRTTRATSSKRGGSVRCSLISLFQRRFVALDPVLEPVAERVGIEPFGSRLSLEERPDLCEGYAHVLGQPEENVEIPAQRTLDDAARLLGPDLINGTDVERNGVGQVWPYVASVPAVACPVSWSRSW